jgi:exopolysaccharide biosynthesis polyprenyl glycosylphosphotransferase
VARNVLKVATGFREGKRFIMVAWLQGLSSSLESSYRLTRGQKLNLAADCLLILLAAIVSTVTLEHPGIDPLVALGMAGFGILFWLLGGRILRHYDVWNGRGIAGDFVLTSVLLVGMTAALGLLRLMFANVAGPSELSRFLVVLVPGIFWVRLMVSWRHMRAEAAPKPVLIVGSGSLARVTGNELRNWGRNQKVTAYLRFANEPENDRLPAPLIGNCSELEAVLTQHVFDEIYVAGNIVTHSKEMQSAIRVCERFGLPFALPACGFRFDRAKPEHDKAVADGYVHYLSVQHKPVQLAMKRAIDILASALALAVLSPLLLVVALVIKFSSRGPIFFKQKRVGLHGRTFNMLKFRSMVINAEELKKKLFAQNEQTGPVFKMKHDPRVTRIGRFIRKYSVDELPQLINILRGEMTIVGPRPPVPDEVAKYAAWQRRRLSVRPGLTCVWQVSGRNQISFEEWMYLDMQYIDHWSLQQDLNLILKTVPVVLTGRGAS